MDFNDINENPIMCLDTIIHENSPLKYLYMPYIIMSTKVPDVYYSYTWNKCPTLKLMLDIGTLVNKLKYERIKVSEFKSFISNYIRTNNIYINEYPEAKIAIDEYTSALECIRNMQYEQKLLESAMTSYAPIVDYSGMCKMPMMTSEDVTDIDEIEYNSDDNIINKIIMLLHKYVFTIMKEANNITPFTQTDFYKLVTMSVNKTEINNAIYYYILAYTLNSSNKDGCISAIKYIDKMDSTIAEEGLHDTSMVDLFVSIANEDLIGNDEVQKFNQFESDRIDEKIYDKVNIDDTDKANMEKKYDLYKLTNYLYTVRHFMHNQTTNSFYMSKYHIEKEYTYMQDNVLVAEIDGEYLCSPVIDLSDDYKFKLVRIDKDNVITVVPL